MTAPKSPLLRRYENMCIHVAFKGAMNRQGYAWLADEGAAAPNPPLFTRHVEFLPSKDHLPNVSQWWSPKHINTTSGRRGGAAPYKVTASRVLNKGGSRGTTQWLPGASWFIDTSHGGTPNIWSNICHFSDTMLPFFEAAHLGQACSRPIGQVLMWQVPRGDRRMDSSSGSYHYGILGAVLEEQARVSGHESASRPRFLFDEDIKAGDTFCFEEVVAVHEPNLQHRSINMQTRASMSTQGVARGFGSTSVRFAFRSALLSHLKIAPPEARPPTITYLSRPYKNKAEAKKYGRVWQQRCHIEPQVLHRLEQLVRRETGYHLNRVVFERTTYAYQAQVISQTDIFWSTHGAGMAHMTLLPAFAAAIEMFNCGHFSYLYANLALSLRVRYFPMQLTKPWCYQPKSIIGDTRKNMTKTYAYKFEEASPVLMQAVRYHFWRDPGDEIHGTEPRCEYAAKVLRVTGALPAGMGLRQWEKCSGGKRTGRAKADDDDGEGGVMRNLGRRRRGMGGRFAQGPQGNGRPGQWTRWGGFG